MTAPRKISGRSFLSSSGHVPNNRYGDESAKAASLCANWMPTGPDNSGINAPLHNGQSKHAKWKLVCRT